MESYEELREKTAGLLARLREFAHARGAEETSERLTAAGESACG